MNYSTCMWCGAKIRMSTYGCPECYGHDMVSKIHASGHDQCGSCLTAIPYPAPRWFRSLNDAKAHVGFAMLWDGYDRFQVDPITLEVVKLIPGEEEAGEKEAEEPTTRLFPTLPTFPSFRAGG